MRTSLRKLRLCQAMRLELGTVHQDCEQHSGQRTALSRLTVRKDMMVCFLLKRIDKVLHGEHWQGRTAKKNAGDQFESHHNLPHY